MEIHLRQLRKERKLSVPALSRLSGVPIRTIENVERTGDCRLSTIVKLALTLNVELNEIVTTR